MCYIPSQLPDVILTECLIVGIATGTVVYVVFFEIIPKAKTVGGTGKQHMLAMILGFCIFLPSLYFRNIGISPQYFVTLNSIISDSVHEENHEDVPVCRNLTNTF